MIGQISIANTRRTLVRPQSLSKSVWIDASDYAVGAISNGTVLTNKGNGSIVFEVVGTGMSVQLNAQNKKEFVFDGATFFRCTSGVADFTKYKNGSNHYTVMTIGTIGTTSNPDAVFGLCGNNAGSSLNHGFYILIDNRTITSAGNRGYQYAVTKAVASTFPVLSRYNTALYNTKRSIYFTFDTQASDRVDQMRLFADGNLEGITDRVRTTANTTSGLGTTNTFASNAPTYAFEIGAIGNGAFPLTGEMEQFILFDERIEINQVLGLDEYFQFHSTSPLNSTFQRVSTIDSITDDYTFGGTYAKTAGKTHTIFVSTTGPDHFSPGSEREGSQVVSTNNIVTFPAAYTTIFTDASNSPQNPSGGYTPTGRLVVVYGRYNSTTGAYNAMVSRYSDDNGTTWSSESSLTVPTTSPALTAYVTHDQLVVCNNGDLAIPAYALSGTSLYKIYVIRSTDNGLTWSFTEVYSSPTVYINEASLAHMGGDDWIMMARIEAASGGFFEYKMFYSDDDLATFSDEGNTDFNLNYVYAHPPVVRTIFIDGTRVIEFSWFNRGTRRWHFKYALPADLIANGGPAWNSKTLYTMDLRAITGTSSDGWRSGYPFIIHPNNDLKFEGMYVEENSTSETTIHFIKVGGGYKARIKSDLGI